VHKIKHSGNKKVKNAVAKTYSGIQFKSLLEVKIFKALQEAGFNPDYEQNKFTIWNGFKPSVKFFDRDKQSGVLKLQEKKILPITYTPDITFFHKGKMIIIEVKGFETDVFLIKRKLFRGYLEANKIDCLYFQIYDSLTLQQAIAIIKSL
jgi:hypothetical protein